MPDSESLFHMHALLESDYTFLKSILHFFALCRGPKWEGMAQYSHPKHAPDVHVLMVTRAGQVCRLVRKSANPQLRTNEKNCGHADFSSLNCGLAVADCF